MNKKLHVKTGDTVVILSGKDKGKKGKVLTAMPSENKLIVEGVNVQTKHQKQTRTMQAEIRHVEGPIDASNVMLYDTKTKQPVKVGYVVEDGKKSRVNKKTGAKID